MRKRESRAGAPRRQRIVILDEQPLVRRGLVDLIQREPDLMVCAEAGGGRAGLQAIGACRPDLLITDLSLNLGDGLSLLKEIHAAYPQLPVLVLARHDAPHYARRVRMAGASGYVTKQASAEALLLAIRRVLRGECFSKPEIDRGRASG